MDTQITMWNLDLITTTIGKWFCKPHIKLNCNKNKEP